MINNFIYIIKSHYADFNGRASLSQYFSFQLARLILVGVFLVPSIILYKTQPNTAYPLIILAIAVFLFLLVPSLAITTRRAHDLGKSFWSVYLNPVTIFYLITEEGDYGENEYGSNPEEV